MPRLNVPIRKKDDFWGLLDQKTAEVTLEDIIIVVGDLKGQHRATTATTEEVSKPETQMATTF